MKRIPYTVSDLLRVHATEASSKEAVVDGNRSLTYSDLLNHSVCFANVLRERGVRPGDRVCLFLPRSLESVISFFAAQLLGEVINLGTALASSVKDIAEKYIELTDADPSLSIQVSDRPGQVREHISSTDKARKLLGGRSTPTWIPACSAPSLGTVTMSRGGERESG